MLIELDFLLCTRYITHTRWLNLCNAVCLCCVHVHGGHLSNEQGIHRIMFDWTMLIWWLNAALVMASKSAVKNESPNERCNWIGLENQREREERSWCQNTNEIANWAKTPSHSSYSCHLFYFRFHEDAKSYESRSRACFTLILPYFFGIFRTIQLNSVQINSYI